MDIPAQCGTTAGRGKNGVERGEGKVCITGVVTIVTLKEAVVNGVAEGEGQSVTGDVRAAAGAVGVVPSRWSEAIGVGGCEGVIKEELHARAEEAA